MSPEPLSLDQLEALRTGTTPGPWTVQLPGEGLYDAPSVHANGSTVEGGVFVAECANHPDGLNDAGLIAAAPDLLASAIHYAQEAERLHSWAGQARAVLAGEGHQDGLDIARACPSDCYRCRTLVALADLLTPTTEPEGNDG